VLLQQQKKTIDIKFSEHCFLNTMEQINVVVTYHVYVAHIEYINFSLLSKYIYYLFIII